MGNSRWFWCAYACSRCRQSPVARLSRELTVSASPGKAIPSKLSNQDEETTTHRFQLKYPIDSQTDSWDSFYSLQRVMNLFANRFQPQFAQLLISAMGHPPVTLGVH